MQPVAVYQVPIRCWHGARCLEWSLSDSFCLSNPEECLHCLLGAMAGKHTKFHCLQVSHQGLPLWPAPSSETRICQAGGLQPKGPGLRRGKSSMTEDILGFFFAGEGVASYYPVSLQMSMPLALNNSLWQPPVWGPHPIAFCQPRNEFLITSY